MDNLYSNKEARVGQMIKAASASLRYPPPYDPEQPVFINETWAYEPVITANRTSRVGTWCVMSAALRVLIVRGRTPY
jgi:hypothetical protein